MRSQADATRTAVLEFVEDRVIETAQLVSLSEVARDLSAAGRRAADELVVDRELVVLYQGQGLPTLVAPRYMFDGAVRQQKRPRWVGDHPLPGQREVAARLARESSALRRYELLELLLYATGVPLEEAVAAALDELGFQDVVVTYRPDDCDVRFRDGALSFLGEAKGKAGLADKDDVLQLSGWVKEEVERGGDSETLRGVVVVNHHRHLAPADRPQEALTDAARRFTALYGFGVWTTLDLHSRLCTVLASPEPDRERAEHRKQLLAKPNLK